MDLIVLELKDYTTLSENWTEINPSELLPRTLL
jgi:hypothetical protein